MTAKNAASGLWSNKTISEPLTHSGDLLESFTGANLTDDVNAILLYSIDQYVKPTDTNPAIWIDGRSIEKAWFDLMLFEVSEEDITVFRDPGAIIGPATRAFQGLASTWVGTWLDFPNDLTVKSTFDHEGVRLRISNSPFWIMECSLGVAMLCVIALLIRHTSIPMPAHSGLLLKDAVTLKEDPTFSHSLLGLGAASDKDIESHLSSTTFSSHSQDLQALQSSVVSAHNLADRSLAFGPNKPWAPMATRTWFVCATLSLALLSIASLEIIQRASDADSAGLKLDVVVSLGQDLVSILPAVVMLTIAMLFSSAEFSIATASSYLRVARSPASIEHFRSNVLQHIPPVAILNQLRLRQWWVSVIMFGALLGSVLTIISSALYTIHSDPVARTVNVQTLDEFNFDSNINGTKSQGSQSFTFMLRSNESLPAGTYDEFAYPSLSLNRTDPVIKAMLEGNRTSTIKAQVPVIRASLDCAAVSQADMTLVANSSNDAFDDLDIGTARYPDYANLTSVSTLPDYCQLMAPSYQKSTTYRIESSKNGYLEMGNTSYVAELGHPLPTTPDVSEDNQSGVTVNKSVYETHYPPGCPSLAFTLGFYKYNSTNTSTSERYVCSQYFEAIPSTLTFNVPDLSLNLDSPPVLHEDQAYIASNLSLNFTHVFSYVAAAGDAFSVSDHAYIDSFFQTIINGSDPMPFAELFGKEHEQKLIGAVQHIYRVYMAQLVGGDMRTTTTNLGTRQAPANGTYNTDTTKIGTVFSATIQDTTQMRVTQNRVPKNILQAILATMIVCLLLGWKDLRAGGKLLPHNPCTIAGRMSYLAGSRFVEGLDEDLNERQLMEKLKREGVRLRLGWWEGETFQGRVDTVTVDKGGGYIGVQSDDSDWQGPATAKQQRRFGIDVVSGR